MLAKLLMQYCSFTQEQLQQLQQEAEQQQQALLVYVAEQKLLSYTELAQLLAKHYELPYRDLKQKPLQDNEQVTNSSTTLLVINTNKEFCVALTEPEQFQALERLRFELHSNFTLCMVDHDLAQQYQPQTPQPKNKTKQLRADQLADELLKNAILQRASDIHIESYSNFSRIRLRIDGVLHETLRLSRAKVSALLNAIKIIANLDITEKRLPQDGRFSFRYEQQAQRHCRISTCPTTQGEKCVIRILEANQRLLNVSQLGMSLPQQRLFLSSLKKTQGIILVTGPTGSGKTLTLYTALDHLNTVARNITSIEDPVEIQLPGINQVNVHTAAQLDFSTALRAFLRQDPDVIMIGEIRDPETAKIAIRAAQTGHLVLATLHTNDCLASIQRLHNLGVPLADLVGVIQLVVSQRLVRTLCKQRKGEAEANCKHCNDGFQGRIGLFECFTPPTSIQELKELLLNKKTYEDLQKKQQRSNMNDAATALVAHKITTTEEIKRVLT